jgi:2'-hydroxyisoflavone reductase
VPPTEEYTGFHLVRVRRAVQAGLTFRPLAETARNTLDWFRTLPRERQDQLKAGLPPARERELLEAWHARDGADM